MLSRYAALVKNLRGVILAKEDEKALQWLLKRFKYRNLGVPPSGGGLRRRKGFSKLLELFYPSESLRELVEVFSSTLSLPREAVEAAVIASAYVSPIMGIGSWADEALSKLAVETVESRVELDEKGWKLHFRILDYTVLDAYASSVSEAESLWNPETNLERFKQKRLRRIRADMKRYWRLLEGSGKPKPLILYVDLALLAAENPQLLRKLRGLNVEASAGLSLEAAILIPGDLA